MQTIQQQQEKIQPIVSRLIFDAGKCPGVRDVRIILRYESGGLADVEFSLSGQSQPCREECGRCAEMKFRNEVERTIRMAFERRFSGEVQVAGAVVHGMIVRVRRSITQYA